MRPRRKTGVVGKAHAPDRDLELPTELPRERPGEPRQDGDGTTTQHAGFGEDFWEGQRPPHW
ncbi:hypothetical protein [Corynebacterium kalidii]|uniref:Uncharacterized protein n=1 Tax=Corynebacterium kalidii TaxID=2931982 RepID=A0A9X1WN38_9CORY|nr:hypothetical protein [Corynebacterium kalidii]MCJ7858091.1 hypothetical protein [Corynebacterium kalidii]